MNTKRFVGSNVNGVLTRQTCSQRSCMSAGSKRRALAFYFCLQICNMFLISKSRGASDLGLCTTSTLVLANRMPPRIGKFRHFLQPNTFINRKSPSRSGTLFASTACCIWSVTSSESQISISMVSFQQNVAKET